MEKETKQEKNWWPIGLLTFGIIFCVCVISMVFVAMEHKWEPDQSYMSAYKQVDKNIDEILKKQKIFDSLYSVKIDTKEFVFGQNQLKLTLLENNTTIVKDANITAVVTRPDTNSFNQNLSSFTFDGKDYSSSNFTLDKPGRWIVEFRIETNTTTGFLKIEKFVTKK